MIGEWISGHSEAINERTREVIAQKRNLYEIVGSTMEDWKNSFEFREVEFLIRFNHPCILSIVGWDIENGFLDIGTEWHEKGSLYQMLENRYQGKPSPRWFDSTGIAIMIAGIVLGMKYVHDQKVIHCNFTPASVLIDDRGRPQIGNFSMSLYDDDSIDINNLPSYLTPKVIERGEFGLPFDVLTFGLLLFELLGGSEVFNGSRQLISDQIRSGDRPSIPGNLPQFSRKLIEECWNRDPTKRPTFQKIFKMLQTADFKVLNDVNIRLVKDYVAEIANLEIVCLSAGFPPALRIVEPPFNPKFWQMDFSGFRRQLLARGAFVSVYKAENPEKHNVIALKTSMRPLSPGELEDLLHLRTFRQILCLIRLNHPCIPSFFGWNISDDNNLEIGTEFFELGSLEKILEERRKTKQAPTSFNATTIAIIIAGMAFGLRHIHDRGLIHRNLTPSNILIDNQWRPRIGGLSSCRSDGLDWTSEVGTPAYLSPEVLENDEYGRPMDVFAFGLIVFELIVGPKVFTGSFAHISTAIVHGVRPQIPNQIPAISRDLITRCWDVNPANRPSFQRIIDDLKVANFQILLNVNVANVWSYVRDIEEMESQCYRTPINIPHIPE
jgi:serine/threonine protein kinase